MAFGGYLFKATTNNVVFPNQYIAKTSYVVEPNQHRVLKSYREDNTCTLHEVLATTTKTKISFETINLDATSATAIVNFFVNNASDATNQVIEITYYNPRTDAYASGTFKYSDVNFSVNYITATKVIMAPLTITLEEF